MLKRYTPYIWVLLFSAVAMPAVGQEEPEPVVAVADTLGLSTDSVAQPSEADLTPAARETWTEKPSSIHTATAIDFDPYDFRLQNRFLPHEQGARHKSDSVKWLNHLRFRLYSGAPLHIVHVRRNGEKELSKFDFGVQWGLGFNYQLTTLHGVRLDYSNISYSNSQVYTGKLNVHDIEAGYLFNLTNYFKGYDPNRRLSVQAGLGLGVVRSKENYLTETAFRGEMSLLFDYRFWRNFSVYAEPYFGVTTDKYDHRATPHGYDYLAGIRAGLSLNTKAISDMNERIQQKKTDLYRPDYWFNHVFFGSSYGRMFTNAPKVPGTARAIVDSHVFIGYQFTPIQSLRLMATYMKSPEGLERKHHVMGEVDYMINFSNMWNGYKPDRHFRVSGYAGVGARYLDMSSGKQAKSMWQYPDKVAPYVTAGLDFHYFFTPQLSLFLEPYGAFALPISDGGKSTLFAGMRGGFQVDLIDTHIYMPRYALTNEDRMVVNQWKRNPMSHFFLGSSGGIMYEHKQVGTNYRTMPFNVFLGYRFTPVQSLRAKASYIKNWENLGLRRNHVQGEIDYMLNFSNLLYGYKPKRWVNVLGYVGVGAKYLEPGHPQFDDDPTKEHIAPMVTSGANVAVRMHNGVSLFVEPYAGLLRAKGQHYYTFTYGLNGGVALNFDDCHFYGERVFGTPSSDWTTNIFKRFYVMGGGGIMGVHTLHFPNQWTFPMNMTLGYRFSPNQSIRARGSYIKTDEKMYRKHHLEGQIDYVLNLSNMLFGYRPDRLVNVLGFAGIGARFQEKSNNQNGIFAPVADMGLDLAIRLKKGLSAYVEPYLGVGKGKGDGYYTMYYGANAGLALAFDDVYNYNPHLGTPSADWAPKFRERFFVGGSAGYQRIQRITDKSVFPMTLFAGYRFSPIHALRLKTAYNKTDEEFNRRYHLTWGVDYMFNGSNLLAGYDPDRKFNIIPYIGLGMRAMENNNPKDRKGYWRLYGNMGADLVLKVTRNINFFVEPYVGGVRSARQGDFIDWFMGVNSGFTIDLLDMGQRFGSDRVHVNHSPFFEATQGIMFPTRFGGGLKAAGTSIDLRAGLWIDPIFGIRGSAIAQDFYYNNAYLDKSDFLADQPTGLAGSTTLKLRCEGLLNPLNLLPSWRENAENRKFDINLAGGIELGAEGKKFYIGKGRDHFGMYGITFAAQLLYNATNRTALYIEPRYEYMNSWYNAAEHYFGDQDNDNVITINAGVRVSRPTAAQKKRNKPLGFQQGWFVGANLGGYKPVTGYKPIGGGHIAGELSLNVGYHISPLHSAKLMYEPSVYRVKDSQTTYRGNDLRVMYMFNFSNFYQGKADRKVDTYMQIGPSLNLLSGKGNHSCTCGLAGGFAILYHLSKRFSLTTEPLAQVTLKRHFLPGPSIGPEMGRLRVDFNAGIMYNF